MELNVVELGFNMGCLFPVGCHRNDGTPTYRPCGYCIGCRLEYSRQWAVRMVHESMLYEDNVFLTLTYNDNNLPKHGSLDKNDLKLFIRRLRNYAKNPIRFYACGEYGEKFARAHYHACIFNLDFSDKEILHKGRLRKFSGKVREHNLDDMYISSDLGKIWKKGFHTIGKLNFETAAYTARYVTKKINGKMKENYYGKREPEFALMSRNPGIGAPWIEKYLTDCYPKDFFTLRGMKMRPPRYYDSYLERVNPKLFAKLKQRREEATEKLPYENDKRRIEKQAYRKNVTKTLIRSYENG